MKAWIENWGLLYHNGHNGLGVAHDYGKAHEWYQKAADVRANVR